MLLDAANYMLQKMEKSSFFLMNFLKCTQFEKQTKGQDSVSITATTIILQSVRTDKKKSSLNQH